MLSVPQFGHCMVYDPRLVLLSVFVISTEVEGSHPILGVHETALAQPQMSDLAIILSCAPQTPHDPSAAVGMTDSRIA